MSNSAINLTSEEKERPFIQMINVRKSFVLGKRSVEVLKGIDLSVREGEMVAVMGASGSGKSTLLNLIGCMDSLSEGTYILCGKDASKLTPSKMALVRNERFGYIIQDYALIREMNVMDNIGIPLEYSRKKISKNKIEELMERFGIYELRKTKASLLSGGEQQRVAIARALVNDPDILLADEPTGALDSENGKQVMQLLRETCDAGKTVVVVTHDPAIADYCDRTVRIKDGKIED